MLKTLLLATVLASTLIMQGFAQNRNTSTREAVLSRAASTAATPQETTQTETTTTRTRRAAAGRNQTGSGGKETEGVLAAFDALIDGIRHANVQAVTSVYWNSPQLILFNYNGTVTKGWEQMRKNRESSYPELKDVKIEIHDRRVQKLGRDGAVVT